MQKNKTLKKLANLTAQVKLEHLPKNLKEHNSKAKQASASKLKTNTVPLNVTDEHLNKFLARLGICSRREADALISQGRIQVNGQIASLGSRVDVTDTILLDGRLINVERPKAIYLALNKPRGIVCTTDLREKNNIVSYLNLPERIFPIGRLDKDSSGLILLTNDGSIVNSILRERYGHSKEYEVEVDQPITADFVKQMQSGVHILGQMTKPCEVRQLGTNKFRIILTQGLNRQIRRMCEALGYKVISLVRLRIMEITLGNLQLGEYRYLTAKEIKHLKENLSKAEGQAGELDD